MLEQSYNGLTEFKGLDLEKNSSRCETHWCTYRDCINDIYTHCTKKNLLDVVRDGGYNADQLKGSYSSPASVYSEMCKNLSTQDTLKNRLTLKQR